MEKEYKQARGSPGDKSSSPPMDAINTRSALGKLLALRVKEKQVDKRKAQERGSGWASGLSFNIRNTYSM